jgi:hypothetical protein
MLPVILNNWHMSDQRFGSLVCLRPAGGSAGALANLSVMLVR